MNPLDLPGREFLVFYVVTAVLAVALAAVLRWTLRQPAAEAAMPPPLFSSEIAYLAGGQKLAVNAAVGRLVHDKCLNLDAAVGTLTVQGPLPKDARPLEAALYREIAEDSERKLAKLYEAATGETDAIKMQLEEQGLLVKPEQASVVRFWPFLVMTLVLGLGVVKVCAGIERGKPVGFLLAVLVVLLFVAVICFLGRPFRSRRGDRLLAKLRHDNAALECNTTVRPEDLLGSEISLALGLFGVGILTHESLAGLRKSMISSAGHGGGGGCGGGGCGGGGCGGGGCGGGCGGCGGCGG